MGKDFWCFFHDFHVFVHIRGLMKLVFILEIFPAGLVYSLILHIVSCINTRDYIASSHLTTLRYQAQKLYILAIAMSLIIVEKKGPIVERKKLVKGRVVLIRKNVVQTMSAVQGLFATGKTIIDSSSQLDFTKSVSFKLISRTNSNNSQCFFFLVCFFLQ